jgi:hypothetical protein
MKIYEVLGVEDQDHFGLLGVSDRRLATQSIMAEERSAETVEPLATRVLSRAPPDQH